MIETHAIERVLEGEDALDLVGFDEGLQHVLHRQRGLAVLQIPPAYKFYL